LNLVKLYKAILESLFVQANETGLLSWTMGDQSKPLMVGDRRLTLPIDEQLGRPNPAIILFHPLSESSTRGESKVLQKMMALVRLRLVSSLSELLQDVTNLCADEDRNRKLSPEASVALTCLPSADEKTVDAMDRILEVCATDPGKLVKIYLKRGGIYHGKKMSRVAVVSFPIYDEFERDDRTIFGVKLRKNDYIGFKKLLEYLLPKIDENEGYNAGSNSMEAPYLDSLVQAYLKVARDLNRIVDVHRKHLRDAELAEIDISWEEDARDWSYYRDEIPPLEDSMGTVIGSLPDAVTNAVEATVSGTSASLFPNRVARAGADLLDRPTPAERVPTPEPAHQAPATRSHAAAARVEEVEEPEQAGRGIRSVTDIVNAARRGFQPEPAYAAHGHHPHPGHPAPGYPMAVPAVPPGEYPGYNRGVRQNYHQPAPAYGGYGAVPANPYGGYAAAPAMTQEQAAQLAVANAYGTMAPAPGYGGYPAPAPAYGYHQPAPGYVHNTYPHAV
jgi:hypothetical protein